MTTCASSLDMLSVALKDLYLEWAAIAPYSHSSSQLFDSCWIDSKSDCIWERATAKSPVSALWKPPFWPNSMSARVCLSSQCSQCKSQESPNSPTSPLVHTQAKNGCSKEDETGSQFLKLLLRFWSPRRAALWFNVDFNSSWNAVQL